MPKLARIEALGYPHHVIQRGNRQQDVFFGDDDKQEYLKILKLQADLFHLKIVAYCLMDNHIHMVVVPQKQGSLARAVGETHRLYTRMVNFRWGWQGYLWQGRFNSFPFDSSYLYECVRYVECNPVRAGLVKSARDYAFSSAAVHVAGSKDPLLASFKLPRRIKQWKDYLAQEEDRQLLNTFREHSMTGRPLGQPKFIECLEEEAGRPLTKSKPGPKKKTNNSDVSG